MKKVLKKNDKIYLKKSSPTISGRYGYAVVSKDMDSFSETVTFDFESDIKNNKKSDALACRHEVVHYEKKSDINELKKEQKKILNELNEIKKIYVELSCTSRLSYEDYDTLKDCITMKCNDGYLKENALKLLNKLSAGCRKIFINDYKEI